ncbi:MAG: class I SAM-dependent methyltransferase [Pedosphaera sp.]|nr:class I SAM-dependent methyltransferase [Pedosphaera sp.]
MNTPAEKIRAEIAERGPISFVRFMELALYCPLCGYYEKKEDTPGQRGDFYTSVSVGPLFGELLAFQFAEWMVECGVRSAECGAADPLRLIEAGAHDGQLARDILNWLRVRRPELFERIEYCIVEPSPTRQLWQRETLTPFSDRVRWFETPRSALRTPYFTVVFSNELLDAFPVHRLGWDAKAKSWFEWGVTLDRERFVWVRLPPPAPSAILHLPSSHELLAVLPDNFTTEICPAAENWWRDAANSLPCGKLLTFDYGLSAEEFFSPQRTNGTLRAYRRHQLADDLLAAPGEHDLTAHVNFTAIQRTGEAAGLKTGSFTSQAQFLTGIAEKIWKPQSDFGEWSPEHTRQFQTLTHPQHLGRAFRVLVQSR